MDSYELEFHRAAAERGHDLQLTCATCPVQVEGQAGHRPVYYRARHGEWRMQIGELTLDGVGEPGAEFALHLLDLVLEGNPLDDRDAGRVCSWYEDGTRTRVCAPGHHCDEDLADLMGRDEDW